jgi:hypothetical protein
MKDAVMEKEGNKAYRIIQDQDPLGRLDCDNLTTIVTGHRRYCLGDENFSNPDRLTGYIEDYRNDLLWAMKWGLFKEIYMYDHSGITVSFGGYGNWPDRQWDCGKLGFIYIKPESVVKLMGWKRINKDRAELLKSYLEQEFNAWKAYLEGDTYNVFNEEGDVEASGTYQECEKYVAEMRKLDVEEAVA